MVTNDWCITHIDKMKRLVRYNLILIPLGETFEHFSTIVNGLIFALIKDHFAAMVI